MFGAGGGTSSYREAEETDLIVLWGSNARETQPIFFGLPGNETWYLGLLSAAAIALVIWTYRAEAPRVSLVYKLLLGAIRLNLILFVMWAILPRPDWCLTLRSGPDGLLANLAGE